MTKENGGRKIMELPGEPTVAETSGLLEELGLAESAKRLGVSAADLDRIMKDHDIHLSSYMQSESAQKYQKKAKIRDTLFIAFFIALVWYITGGNLIVVSAVVLAVWLGGRAVRTRVGARGKRT